MNGDVRTTSGALLAEGVGVFRRNCPALLMAGVAIGLLEIGQRVANQEKLGGVAGILLVAVVVIAAEFAVQGIVARAIFVREGVVDATVPARFGAYIGTSALVLIGISVGLVLLVVPGILLALRWALAANFTLTRGMGIREAMKSSGEMTDGHRGEIFGAYVVVGLAAYVPMVVFVPLAGGFNELSTIDPLSVLGLARAVWGMMQATAELALTVGIFAVFVGRHGRLEEVFA